MFQTKRDDATLSSKEKSGQSRGNMWRSISGSSEIWTTQIGSEEKQLLDLLQRRMELSDFADSPAESIEQATGVIE